MDVIPAIAATLTPKLRNIFTSAHSLIQSDERQVARRLIAASAPAARRLERSPVGLVRRKAMSLGVERRTP
jgi:hypothetical protein